MTQLMASDKWKQLPWKKFQRIVFRLQRRIWKAQKTNNYRLVRQLQKLLLRNNGHTIRALQRQGYKCEECSLAFLPEDKVELHHIDGNHHNWKTKNLVALHRECHQGQKVHSFSRQQKVKS